MCIRDRRTGERAGFGLAAVAERIALYYGLGYGMTISSKEGEGTTAVSYTHLDVYKRQDNGSGSDSDGSGSYYESLPAGVPYTSGFSTPSGVASIVASGEGDEESRVLYDNGCLLYTSRCV